MPEAGGQMPDSRPATPRWVKALVVGALLAAVLVIVFMLAAGGEHGPGRHGGFVDAVSLTLAARGA